MVYRLNGVENRRADRERQAALFEFTFLGAVLGVEGIDNLDLPGVDDDVATGGKEVAADLLVRLGVDAHVAFDAADGTGGGAGEAALLILALLLTADGDAKAARAEDAGTLFFLEAALCTGIDAGENVKLALGA